VKYVTDTGTAAEFRRRFELPILKGRDAAATDAEHERGKQKLQEVIRRCSGMIRHCSGVYFCIYVIKL